ADDYVAKPFSMAELLSRVRAILRRRELDRTSGDVRRVGGVEIDLARHAVVVDGRPVELTRSEFRLLALLAATPGRVFTPSEGTYVVSVYGELDLHTVGQLEAELEAAVAHGAQRLVVDLACVSFMDSTALGALVAAHRTLRLASGDLSIVSDDPRVVRVFQIT